MVNYCCSSLYYSSCRYIEFNLDFYNCNYFFSRNFAPVVPGDRVFRLKLIDFNSPRAGYASVTLHDFDIPSECVLIIVDGPSW